MCGLDIRNQQSLHSCFLPIFSWLRILGIYLFRPPKIVYIVYSVILFICSLASNVASVAFMFFEQKVHNTTDISIYTWTFMRIVVLDNINFTVSAVAAHFMLLYRTQETWKKLWKSLTKVELEMKYIKRGILVLVSLLFVPVTLKP